MAVNRYLEVLQPVVACVTDSVLNVSGGYYARDRPHELTLGDSFPVTLGGSSELVLSISQLYRIVGSTGTDGSWSISVVSYRYVVGFRSGAKLLSFHWHPHGQSPTTWPHLHIEAGAQLGYQPLARAHLPTGHVTVGEIVRMLLQDFEVEPRRSDWREIVHGIKHPR